MNQRQGSRLNSSSGTLILLLGQSGAGKSHFINTVAGQQLATVCHGQGSGDLEVSHHIIDRRSPPGSKLIFVDTPGWDNLNITDDKIMKKIAKWLDEQCDTDVRVGGILFLHDITQDRPNVPPTWPVRFLSAAVTKRLFLATAKWDLYRSWGNNPEKVEQREAELVKVDAWQELVQRGAQLCRFENDERSAWEVLNELLKSDPLDLGTLIKGLNQMGTAIERALHPPSNKPGFWKRICQLMGFLGRIFS